MGAKLRDVRLASLAVAVFVPLSGGCSDIRWERSLDAGLNKAAREGRPALVQFHSVLSGDCLEMDQEVFADPEIQEKVKLFVPVRLEYQLNRKLAEELGVAEVPAFLVFRRDRSIAAFQAGKMDKERFSLFLIKYRYY